MLNLRIGGIVAGAAFILSLLIGLVSRTSVPLLFIRPVLFAAVFFAISALAGFLVNNFLPELLDKFEEEETIPAPGSRVNITEAAPPPSAQAFFGAQADESDEGLGNISDLVNTGSAYRAAPGRTPAGMDQNRQNGYTTEGGVENFSGGEDSLSGEPAALEEADPADGGGSGPDTFEPEGFPGSVDILPDFDSMAGAFSQSDGAAETDTTEYSVAAPVQKPSSGARAPAWAGDFNAKDMAAGLRTIIRKEKEG